jgi:hypothetical protein
MFVLTKIQAYTGYQSLKGSRTNFVRSMGIIPPSMGDA